MKSGWQIGSAPRLRVREPRLGLAMAWRSSMSPSLTGTEVATWSVVSRRIVFWRMKYDRVSPTFATQTAPSLKMAATRVVAILRPPSSEIALSWTWEHAVENMRRRSAYGFVSAGVPGLELPHRGFHREVARDLAVAS